VHKIADGCDLQLSYLGFLLPQLRGTVEKSLIDQRLKREID
jgi:hypothetical protein